MLIDKGAKINTVDNVGRTALDVASEANEGNEEAKYRSIFYHYISPSITKLLFGEIWVSVLEFFVCILYFPFLFTISKIVTIKK